MNNKSQIVFVIKTEFDGSLIQLSDALSTGMKLALNKDVRCILRDPASEEHSTTLSLNMDKFAKSAGTKLKYHLAMHLEEANIKKLEQEQAQRDAELRTRRESLESMRKQLERNDLSEQSVAQNLTQPSSPPREVSPVRDASSIHEASVKKQRDASPRRTPQKEEDGFVVPDESSLSEVEKNDLDNSDESQSSEDAGPLAESDSGDSESFIEEIKKTPRKLRPSTSAPRPTRKCAQIDRFNPGMPDDRSRSIRVSKKGTLRAAYRNEFETFLMRTFNGIENEDAFIRLFDKAIFFQHVLSVMKRCWLHGIENRKDPGYFTEASLRVFIQQSFRGCKAGTANCSKRGKCAACGQTKPLAVTFLPNQLNPSEYYRLGRCCGAGIELVILCLNKLTVVLDKVRIDGASSASKHSCVKSFYEAVAILEEHDLE